METGLKLDELARLVRQKREEEKLSLRSAAKQCGVSPATLSRIEAARGTPDTETLVAVTNWLGATLDRFLALANSAPAHEVKHGRGEKTPDIIEAHLRADPKLSPETVKALANMFRALYKETKDLSKPGTD